MFSATEHGGVDMVRKQRKAQDAMSSSVSRCYSYQKHLELNEKGHMGDQTNHM